MGDRHVLVVGGGIVGLSAAYFLARRGAQVTLIEKGRIDDSASTGNAGLVALGHPPLPRPGLTLRALRWMLDGTSPLFIAPRPDPRLLAWLVGFRRACRPAPFARSVEFLAAHGREAGACFRDLVEAESIDCGYRAVGQMDVFRTADGLRRGEQEAAMLGRYGYESEIVGGAELRRREPAFREEVAGAVLFKDRAFASPDAFVTALAARARAHGAELREGTAAHSLLLDGGRCVGARLEDGERIEAGAVVLAAGIWTTELARQAGVRVPMQPGKGYHLELAAPSPCPGVASVLAERFVAATPMNGGLRLAGTLEFSGINHRLVLRRLEMLRVGAALYLHGIDEAEVRSSWCGLRPCTADGLPAVGWAPGVESLFVATGHAMMGFTLGPLAGRLACAAILDGTPAPALLDPGRFARGEQRGSTQARRREGASGPRAAAPEPR